MVKLQKHFAKVCIVIFIFIAFLSFLFIEDITDLSGAIAPIITLFIGFVAIAAYIIFRGPLAAERIKKRIEENKIRNGR